MPSRLKDLLFVLLSAGLLVAPYHHGAFWPAAFIAFIPYFLAISNKTRGEAALISFIAGVFFYVFLGYWLTAVSIPGFILVVAYLALYFAVFGYGVAPFVDARTEYAGALFSRNLKAILFIASFWTILEWARSWFITGIPWALLAYTQWKNIAFIQIADIVGAYGVSFCVIAVNLFLFKLIRPSSHAIFEEAVQKKQYGLRMAGVLASLLFVVLAYGFIHLKKPETSPTVLHVSVAQGNVPQEEKWDARIKGIIFEKYKRLTFMSAIERSDLIVWPETSFPGYLEDEPVMASQLRSVARQSKTWVLVGAPTIGDLEKGLRFFNSAILFSPNGEEAARYSKLHLVPFGEYVPLEPILGWVRSFAEIGRFDPGQELTVFQIESRYQPNRIRPKFGVLICFEDIFPGLVRRFVLNGADFLVNMTNDAWFGRTSAPYQHAQASIFRAVENRVPVVRAANTGLSCFISSEGRIVASVNDKGQEIFVTGHQGYDITLRKGQSFYTRFGDLFLLLPAILLFALRKLVKVE
ncbi:MAG: apolipoprotein N-acyltransferase [Candidatus Omnitrophica bacterium]|nr:apolipoprotein N-acyltransferase [Candidatus Omnitrophota bacterium]